MFGKRVLSTCVVAVLSFGIVACGGGGSGDGGSGNPSPSFPPSAKAAAPTIKNVQTAKAQIRNMGFAVGFIFRQFSTFQNDPALLFASKKAIDKTNNCASGGTVHVHSEGSNTADITILVDYKECNQGRGNVMTGSAKVNVADYNATKRKFASESIVFQSDFYVKDNNGTNKISQGSYFAQHIEAYDSNGFVKSGNVSMSIMITGDSLNIGVKDFVLHFDQPQSDRQNIYLTKGRIYIDNLSAYVDYDTSYDMSKTPLVYSNITKSYVSGEEHFLMSNGAKAKFVVQSGVERYFVDANGDGVYELQN